MIQEMKDWLGDGEYDIDFMLRTHVISQEAVVRLCLKLTDSPWYGWHL